MKVVGKKIIVTGAGSGIGKELTIQLLRAGATVIALDINKENLENLKKEINKESLYIYPIDVRDAKALAIFKEEYFKMHETIDILINNAGIIQPFENVEKLDDETINRVMEVNFYGPLNLTRLFLPQMLGRPEAHIVNISSMGGFFPFPGQTIYGASKAALKLFTEGLYAELLGTNVHVTLVFPGAIATNIASNSNIKTEKSESDSKFKMLSAAVAADEIIFGIEKNKFQLYVGSDSKFMNFIYKINPKAAIKYIKSKMKNM